LTAIAPDSVVPTGAEIVPAFETINPYNLALCGSLVRVYCLRVNVERDSAVRVPQELLYGLHVFPIRLQQRVEGVEESVLGDAGFARDRLI
jgi:hypothetical protein